MSPLLRLPLRTTPWPLDIQQAFRTLDNIYDHALAALQDNALNLTHIQYHYNIVTRDAHPLLNVFENNGITYGLSPEWLRTVKDAFETLSAQLEDAKRTSSGTDTTNIGYINPITVEHTGKRGRPRKVIDPNFILEATQPSRNITLMTLAKSLGVHRNTIQSYLKQYGFSRKFSDVSDGDLDTLVRSFRDKYPESGLRYLRGYIRSHGLRIQRKRITGLHASTNNRAETVLEMFLDAAIAYGLPSRVRGDRGALYGAIYEQHPYRTGMGEVGGQFARAWRGFFLRLERQHHLDHKNPHHRWILHFLFLGPTLPRSLQHGIYKNESASAHMYENTQPQGEETAQWSSSEMCEEDRMDVDADGQSGSEDDGEWYDDDEHNEPRSDRQWTAASAETTVRHKPVKVPHSVCPFDKAGRQLFETAVSVAQEHNFVPAGYGVLLDEWDDDGYPSEEIITSGKKGGKELRAEIDHDISVSSPRPVEHVQASVHQATQKPRP
ncbi:Integrase catalytic domain-containing protein [Salix suchowensis]|nr:Integrase catalytic domain-containing protein [Salix suchowensis]